MNNNLYDLARMKIDEQTITVLDPQMDMSIDLSLNLFDASQNENSMTTFIKEFSKKVEVVGIHHFGFSCEISELLTKNIEAIRSYVNVNWKKKSAIYDEDPQLLIYDFINYIKEVSSGNESGEIYSVLSELFSSFKCVKSPC